MGATSEPSSGVTLRQVTDDDLSIFFEDQADPDAAEMADFPARSLSDHMAHWRKILADDSVITRTVLHDGQVVGNIVSWSQNDRREVGYWIDKSHWGKGVATAALDQFLEIVTTRPLYAYVAPHNEGSIRVLERCGFGFDRETGLDDAAHLVLVLLD